MRAFFTLLQWGRRRSRRINAGCAWRRCESCTTFNGAADDLGGSTGRHAGGATYIRPSMGPPTISADQRVPHLLVSSRVSPFNGAADDLGGSTLVVEYTHRTEMTALQWGRRRSRRINGEEGRCVWMWERPSMGPPTISADQRGVRICARSDSSLQWGRRRSRRINDPEYAVLARAFGPSMGPPTISADQRGVLMQTIKVANVLQWGRRRSRRINGPKPKYAALASRSLQWGRRRSRRINFAMRLSTTIERTFNGAADDLGGSTASG